MATAIQARTTPARGRFSWVLMVLGALLVATVAPAAAARPPLVVASIALAEPPSRGDRVVEVTLIVEQNDLLRKQIEPGREVGGGADPWMLGPKNLL